MRTIETLFVVMEVITISLLSFVVDVSILSCVHSDNAAFYYCITLLYFQVISIMFLRKITNILTIFLYSFRVSLLLLIFGMDSFFQGWACCPETQLSFYLE